MAGQLHFYYPLEEGSRFLEESTHSCIFGVAKRNYEIHILFEWRGIYVYYSCLFSFQIYIDRLVAYINIDMFLELFTK